MTRVTRAAAAPRGAGCIILGPPCEEAGEGAKAHLWWDYEIVAKRALGVSSLGGWWPRSWTEVIHAALGAAAASRKLYLAVFDVPELLRHPYIMRQIALGRVAVYVGQATPRYGASQEHVDAIRRMLISAASIHRLHALDAVNDVLSWIPAE